MDRVPGHIINIVGMSTGEGSRRAEFHLDGPERIIACASWTPTVFSGDHTLVILSMPTAASFFPSQLQAT